jgi:FemAB-related protein (PEP-CTERM system-associated)
MTGLQPAVAQTCFSIKPFDQVSGQTWDRFVHDSGGSFFHLSGWKALFEEVFGFRTHYMAAEKRGQIAGILPLVEQNSILFGRGLIAAPFCVEGGPLGSETACLALEDSAKKLMYDRKASFIEFRSRSASRKGWQIKKDQYATFKRSLAGDEAANLKAIPRKQRAVVRKALDSGLTIQVHNRPEIFYPIYARSVQNLGTPVFPLRYFRRICELFEDQCDIVVVYDGPIAVSAVLSFYFGDTVLPYYGGGLPAARRSGANDLMYWGVMCRAAERGCTSFDFGRSKAASGAFSFKKNWGFEPQWLEYEYWLPDGGSLPDNNAASPKYAMMVGLWKKLPHWLADRAGPQLIRHLN